LKFTVETSGVRLLRRGAEVNFTVETGEVVAGNVHFTVETGKV
jgi:cold shock CspA family protein